MDRQEEQARTRFAEVIARIGPLNHDADAEEHPVSGVPAHVMLASANAAWRKRVRGAALRTGMLCTHAGSLARAQQMLSEAGTPEGDAPSPALYDLVLADCELPDGAGIALAGAAEAAGSVLVLAAGRDGTSVQDAVEAMRAGAADLLMRASVSGPELASRLTAAAARSRTLRGQRERIFKLRRMCRRLNDSRREVVRQVGSLCTDLLQAYQELTGHMNQVTTATEFKGLIRGELDIEALLRTTLEFVLARSGPTNAAVFLPTTSGDYSLGAYVNYDCPKETCDVLLDHLANVIAPRFENAEGMVHLTDQKSMDGYIGEDADWLSGSHVVGFPCRHDGECLAIFMLFRDQRSPFGQTLLEQLKTVGELFAAQLARVIHIHHRHLPKDKWGMLGDAEPDDTEQDDYGLAA